MWVDSFIKCTTPFEPTTSAAKYCSTSRTVSLTVRPTRKSNMARRAVYNYVTAYYRRVLEPDFKAFYPYKSNLWKMEDILPEKSGSVEDLLGQFKEKVDLNGIHDGSGLNLAGFSPNTGNYPSGLGTLYMMLAGIHRIPEWRVVDQKVLKWLLGIVGYSSSKSTGFLTSGGTSSSIIAMLAAREASKMSMADVDRSVVYLTDTVHNCADIALKAVGLSSIVFRQVSFDCQRRMVLADLERKIQQDIEKDLLPFMVIGSLGEVDSGGIDPLEGMADIADSYGLWFHVDAAYGGFFLMCDELQEKARGVEQADSIIINLHKGLFQTFGSSAVLFKRGVDHLLFVKGTKIKPLRGNPIEDSSPFRGFPALMFLNTLGLKHVRAVTLEKMMLAEFMYSYLTQCPGISVPVKPELSKLLFAIDDADIDEANRKTEALVKEMTKDGRIVLITTSIDGRVYIHVCISAFRTHLRDVLFCLQKLKEVVTDKFGFQAPNMNVPTYEEQMHELRCLEEDFLTFEKKMSKLEFPVKITEAAERYAKGQTMSKKSLTDYIAPPSLMNGKSVHPNDNRTLESALEIPEHPKSLDEIVNKLSSLRSSKVDDAESTGEADLLEPGILGHFLMASTNRFSAQWVSSPGNIELEGAIPDWLKTVTGFPDSAKGVLCNDSCSADILCLFAARCTKVPHPHLYERAVVYGSARSLQAISQPLHVLGLAGCNRSEFSQSADGLLVVKTLMENIREDLQDEKRTPFLVVLSITPHGLEASNDDLQTLMAFCREHGIWVHIHVSDGAPFLLADLDQSPAMKHSGLSEADSISINLTECLCQPQEVAAVLVRDHNLLLSSLQPQREANYFRNVKTVKYEPAAYSLELTRPSRAVAVWFAMYLHGAEKLRQHIAKLRPKSSDI